MGIGVVCQQEASPSLSLTAHIPSMLPLLFLSRAIDYVCFSTYVKSHPSVMSSQIELQFNTSEGQHIWEDRFRISNKALPSRLTQCQQLCQGHKSSIFSSGINYITRLFFYFLNANILSTNWSSQGGFNLKKLEVLAELNVICMLTYCFTVILWDTPSPSSQMNYLKWNSFLLDLPSRMFYPMLTKRQRILIHAAESCNPEHLCLEVTSV